MGRHAYSRTKAVRAFWKKVERGGDDDCWPWLGSLNAKDSGKVHIVAFDETLAHRLAYVLIRGKIPNGASLHCTCQTGNRCVNPNHYKVVLRVAPPGTQPSPKRPPGTRREFCSFGHAMTEENTYSPPSRPKERSCLTCRRERSREHWKRSHAISTRDPEAN